MKGNSPESSFRHSKNKLSSPPSPVCLALLAPVGFDLCGAAPLIKPLIVPCFHAGAWEALEGTRPCPWCPPHPAKIVSYPPSLHDLFAWPAHLNQGRKSAEPACFQNCRAYYVSTRWRFDFSGLMWCHVTVFLAWRVYKRSTFAALLHLQSGSCNRCLQTWEMKSLRLLQRLK